MADTKITALAALTGANVVDADVAPVVDISDLSMAASGTTKNITMAELGIALGTARVNLNADATNGPTAPSTGTKLYGSQKGRILPAVISSYAGSTPLELQPAFGTKQMAFYQATGNATTVVTPGITLTAIGTATTANWANTNLFTQSRRLSYISAAGAGSAGGWRENVLKYLIGNAGQGGFSVSMKMGFLTLPAGYRVFMGLYGVAGVIGNVDPSSLVNLIGFGKDTADTTLQFMHNDGAGTATKTATGMAALATSDLIECRFHAPPGTAKVYWACRNITQAPTTWYTGDTGVSTDLPAATQGLAIQNWCNNAATASAINPHWVNYYIETDN